jgi:Ca2+/Na+ antiporter
MRHINGKKIVSIVMMLCFSLLLNAQETDKQTDLMRSNGRIYVVIAVMLTILIGLVLYIVRLDRKLTKLEKEN